MRTVKLKSRFCTSFEVFFLTKYGPVNFKKIVIIFEPGTVTYVSVQFKTVSLRKNPGSPSKKNELTEDEICQLLLRREDCNKTID